VQAGLSEFAIVQARENSAHCETAAPQYDQAREKSMSLWRVYLPKVEASTYLPKNAMPVAAPAGPSLNHSVKLKRLDV